MGTISSLPLSHPPHPSPKPLESIGFRRDGSVVVLTLGGVFTSAAHTRLGELLDWFVRQGSHSVRVDLSSMAGVDSRCLSLLHSAQRQIRSKNGELTAFSLREEIARQLILIGLAPGDL